MCGIRAVHHRRRGSYTFLSESPGAKRAAYFKKKGLPYVLLSYENNYVKSSDVKEINGKDRNYCTKNAIFNTKSINL